MMMMMMKQELRTGSLRGAGDLLAACYYSGRYNSPIGQSRQSDNKDRKNAIMIRDILKYTGGSRRK
jgi:hypothetical protein